MHRFLIAGAIVLFRTIVNIIVSKSVAQIPWWYRFIVLFQLNFLYDGYISLKGRNLTPLYQVSSFKTMWESNISATYFFLALVKLCGHSIVHGLYTWGRD
eukprot:TRINITY_DN2018_c0_g1_i10.p1 TRINITY_DN2018_c0_g1~~TRINITY_DN2018_c0_g1_i10.p1  ORF type:complete len:100 (-),score=2.76 TRINITY_DN2018_c0_g1_i10:1176-1475(-)